MTARIELKGISVAKPLSDFVDTEVLPGTGVAREFLGRACAARCRIRSAQRRAFGRA